MVHKFKDGSMWEGGGFTIDTNHICSQYGDGEMCKHCHSKTVIVHKRHDGTTYNEDTWTCPKVVIATNEGGHNSTGVCLDCIMEASKIIDENNY